MSNRTKNQKKVKPKSSPPPEIPSTGQPVYSATVNIGASKIALEISNPNKDRQVHEFGQLSEDMDQLIHLLKNEKVRGVQLKGKKITCRLLAEKLLKQGIRPLIADSEKQKKSNSNDHGIKGMPVIDGYVAGIDIGQNLIFVAIPPNFDQDHTRVFGTFTHELKSIVSWLMEHNIKTVAMESTSVYWMPLSDLCEESGITPIIVNPKHVKMFPGRKTDTLDAQWLMRLLACGLLKGGFVPPQPYRALRDLARHRADLMDRGGQSLNRVHKMLELMNIKLSCVLSDLSGKSSLSMIRAIVNGERDPDRLAQLAEDRCKSTKEEFRDALTGTYNEEHIHVMRQEMILYDLIHKLIVETELKIQELLEKLDDVPDLPVLPERSKRRRNKEEYNRSPYSFDLRPLLYNKFGYDLTVISGIEEASAAVILFETGGNFDAFPTVKHFASWCGVCPGNKISGDKKLSGKAPKKFSRVGQAFRVAANANHKSDNITGAFIRRLKRKGKKGTEVCKAAAHKICRDVWNIVRHGQEYAEKSAEIYEKEYEERKIKAMTKKLKAMGYAVIDEATGELM